MHIYMYIHLYIYMVVKFRSRIFFTGPSLNTTANYTWNIFLNALKFSIYSLFGGELWMITSLAGLFYYSRRFVINKAYSGHTLKIQIDKYLPDWKKIFTLSVTVPVSLTISKGYSNSINKYVLPLLKYYVLLWFCIVLLYFQRLVFLSLIC